MKVNLNELQLGYSELTECVYIHDGKGNKIDVTNQINNLIKIKAPNQKTLSPETIDVINRALYELKCLNVEEMLGIKEIDVLKQKNIKQAQQEFNAVYGGGE